MKGFPAMTLLALLTASSLYAQQIPSFTDQDLEKYRSEPGADIEEETLQESSDRVSYFTISDLEQKIKEREGKLEMLKQDRSDEIANCKVSGFRDYLHFTGTTFLTATVKEAAAKQCEKAVGYKYSQKIAEQERELDSMHSDHDQLKATYEGQISGIVE
jgi:hypothetical protein